MFDDECENVGGERSTQLSYDYLNRAFEAQQAGEDSLATSLYLAAFDCAQNEGIEAEEDFIKGLKQAWFLAATSKRRTMAEHIFELLEPYLSREEVERYAERLQSLAMDRLEEYGVPRAELETMLNVVPQEIAHMQAMTAGMNPTQNVPFFGLDLGPLFPPADQIEEMVEEAASACGCGNDNPECQCDKPCDDHDDDSTNIESKAKPVSQIPGAPQVNMMAFANPQNMPFLQQLLQGANNAVAAFTLPGGPQKVAPEEKLTYAHMAGFERTIEKMQAFGIGVNEDPAFKEFVQMLNEKHGLQGMPVSDSLLFRSPAREDASRFMEATLGELGIPGIRVHVEEGAQGNLMLCVFAQTRSGLKLNAARNEIEGSGVLLLEDIDLWGHLLPDEENCSNCGSDAPGNKGAREALRLIRSAVDNPEVYVLASCSTEIELDGWILDLLEPLSVIDIDYPTEAERLSLWNDLMNRHSSMADADLDTLVAFSKKLPRFDIYMAAREAIDACYKASLVSRVYEPVTTAVLCEKLAAYQPLESDEYKHLEDQVVEDFRHELEDIDALLGFENANTVADLLGEDFDGLESAESTSE